MTASPSPEPYTYTILIVDDSPANLGLVVEGLADYGFRIIVAQDGVEGLQRADLVQPDLILLDVMMPGLGGFETCRRLKALGSTRDIPVIFMTALTDIEDKVTAFEVGGVDYVTKPLKIDEVIARINTHLSLHGTLRQLAAQNALLQQEIIERRTAQEALEASREPIRRQRDELLAEQKIAERLLVNLLPAPITARIETRPNLIAGAPPSEAVAESVQMATVLFADIVQCSRFSADMEPEQLIAVLNDIFSDFDRIADHRGVEKIKTRGEAYMAAAGLSVPVADHAMRAAHMALDMVESVARFNERRGYALALRIGINSGAVAAGVMGRRKFAYDLWGDAVNIASHMEPQNVAASVHMTQACKELLGEAFLLEERDTVSAAGTVRLPTWFLVGRSAASSE